MPEQRGNSKVTFNLARYLTHSITPTGTETVSMKGLLHKKKLKLPESFLS